MVKTVLFSIIVLFAFISCQNESNPVSTIHDHSFVAKVGAENWQGKSYVDFARSEKQSLFLIPDNKEDYLVLSFEFNGVGEYLLEDSSVSLVETIGGDVLKATYHSVYKQNDILVVSFFDENSGIIKGSFSSHIKKESETILVSSEQFEANFININ